MRWSLRWLPVSPEIRRASAYPQLVTLPSREDVAAPESQLDLRGWRVEDALSEVDAYLNEAALAGMSSVRLLHGKGTGALRQAIRDELRTRPLVKS